MIKTLPDLRLAKTQDLVLINVDACVSDFTNLNVPYSIDIIKAHLSDTYLDYIIGLKNSHEVPYAIVADYEILSHQDFAFVKKLRTNPILSSVPVIAVAKKGTTIDINILNFGVDDCYKMPFDCINLKERVEFLHDFKAQVDAAELKNEDLSIKISLWKRALDISAASIGLIIISPILITTAVLIRLESKGPVIYKSKRSGSGFQVFDFLKFRSMYQDADSRLGEMKHLNQYGNTDTTFVKFKNDPRITRVGRFIRKTSIDELPQLFNILKGDMSLVGNRPLPLYEAECLTKEEAAYRFLAPAGITGLWQIMKRGSNDMSVEERINLDVTYAKNHNFWYDLKILAKTPFAIIQKENV